MEGFYNFIKSDQGNIYVEKIKLVFFNVERIIVK